MSTGPSGSAGLVLAESAERTRIRELQRLLGERRDEVGALELELETLRETLARVELRYQLHLREEHWRLARVASLLRLLDRWAELLREAPREQVAVRAKRIEARRAREAERLWDERQAPVASEEGLEVPVEPRPRDESLRSLFRRLARRFHPDLASSEEERVRFGQWMTRINQHYHARDVEGLRRLSEQVEADGDPDLSEDAPEALIARLSERLRWFETVVLNLKEQLRALERSATYELWCKLEEGRAEQRDVFPEIAAQLRETAKKQFADVRLAAIQLERQVSDYNRRGAELSRQGIEESGTLDRIFDPYANRQLMRLGVEALAQAQFSPSAQARAEELEGLAASKPSLLRLLLFTYVSERCQHAPPGLESYEALTQRFVFLGREDRSPATLEETLVEAGDMLEFGVLRATERRARAGLRFRSEVLREAVPLSLRGAVLRRVFRQVLSVLGKLQTCKQCKQSVYEMPLYRLRGLDDLHASVCPACGETLSSYWMPSGKNIQSELNDAFLDLELVAECSFRIARESIALQFLPRQTEEMTVGDLKRRFCAEVLDRHQLEIEASKVFLTQRRKRVDESVVLADLEETSFGVTFAPDAPVTPAEAMEVVRHRVRNRFKANAPSAPTPPRR